MKFTVDPATIAGGKDGYRLAIETDDGGDVYYISDDELYGLLAGIIWAIRNKNSSSNRTETD